MSSGQAQAAFKVVEIQRLEEYVRTTFEVAAVVCIAPDSSNDLSAERWLSGVGAQRAQAGCDTLGLVFASWKTMPRREIWKCPLSLKLCIILKEPSATTETRPNTAKVFGNGTLSKMYEPRLLVRWWTQTICGQRGWVADDGSLELWCANLVLL